MKTDRGHLMGIIFILVALAMVIQGVWLSYKQDRESRCQSDYNQKTAVVVQQRAQWADEDRSALNQMIFEVIDKHATEKQRAHAVQHFADTAKKNDQNRKANPLPTRTQCDFGFGWL